MNSKGEIHIDEDEDRSHLVGKESSHRSIILSTLIHKIEHAMGILCSDITDSVMFGYYNGRIDLSNDNILAI